jgi:hypothetical protein
VGWPGSSRRPGGSAASSTASREDLERAIAGAGALERAFADLGRELGELRALRERLCRDRP